MKIENIIVDLDGTLVDSLLGIHFSAQEAIQSVLPGWKLPELHPLIGPPIRQIFQKAFVDLPAKTLDALESHFRKSYDNEGYKKGMIYAGVRETLASLTQKRFAFFLVTNKPIAATTSILDHSGISAYFKGVISPDIVNPPFPNKVEMAAYLLKKYNLNPRFTILVGDSVDDSRAAKDCGLFFGAVAYGYGGVHLHPRGPNDIVLSTFPDLLRIVETG